MLECIYIYLRNVFNGHPSNTTRTWVGAVYASKTAKRVIKKRKLFEPRTYEYNFGSYLSQSL